MMDRSEREFAPWLYQALRAALGRSDRLDTGPMPGPDRVLDGGGRALLPTIAAIGRRLSGVIPIHVLNEARVAAGMTVMTNESMLREFGPVSQALDAAGIRWAVVKGLDHLARFYPGLQWRAMSDADILVDPNDIESARGQLERLGFEVWEPKTSSMQPALLYFNNRLYLDVHRTLGRKGMHAVPTGTLLDETEIVSLQGVQYRLLTPGRSFAAHVLLSGKDAFAAAKINGLRLVELTMLADSLGDGEIEGWKTTMTRWGAGKVYARALELIAWVRGGAKPGWCESGLGEPEWYLVDRSTRWSNYKKYASLQDSPAGMIRYLAGELGTSVLRFFTARRSGGW